jgi:hypothetical protein
MEQENEPLEYWKFILVDGYLKRNPEIRHGINLALKLFHHNSTAVEIFRSLAKMYGNIEDDAILQTVLIIREKGCRFNADCGKALVSLKASFPLEDPTAGIPEIGLDGQYILLQATEESRLSQRFSAW